MEQKTVVRYYRKGGQLRGCVIGIIKDGVVRIGWSLYHKSLEVKAGVPFTKKTAREWATARAIEMPQSLCQTAEKVKEQCDKIRIQETEI